MVLDKELETYERKLPELLLHEGKFVVVHNDDVIGFFDSYPDALQVAYTNFHSSPFLVKQIQAVEQVQFVARA